MKTDLAETSFRPSIILRPALARWLWERGLNLRQGGELFGCSYEQTRLICLPFDDPGRRVPVDPLMAAIVRQTNGQIRPADFYPPHLNTAASQVDS